MRMGLKAVAALLLTLPALASTQRAPAAYQAPSHNSRSSPFFLVPDEQTLRARADAGMQIEQSRDPARELEEHRKLGRALAALQPQRPGIVDAYVISIALDSDPVFGREARVAGDVLAARYGARGRSIILAGSDGSAPSRLPRGTPEAFGIALARIAELIDKDEDVVVIYTTSHGAPFGLYYHDADNGYGAISPNRFRAVLEQLGIRNRLLILSACYSGIFVPRLQSDTTAIVTAASADRSSFGCVADNDWTFFGDAMINHALRKPQPLRAAFTEADGLITSWEAQFPVRPSQPQVSIGGGAERWLAALDRRLPPTASQPVGRPAVETSRELMRR
ncbi:MAG TPA: C13 family peptidase [Allosphingosinicella sp.]|nr:C13 family peptidase [Allosphingosinicella sp.]